MDKEGLLFNRRKRRFVILGLLTALALLLACAGGEEEETPIITPMQTPESPTLADCITFDGQIVGTSYKFADTFTDSGVPIIILRFEWPDGQLVIGNEVRVASGQLAGGTGNEMSLNNVNMGFDIAPCECISFRYCYQGGNTNMIINNDFKNIGSLYEINNTRIGGVHVSVLGSNIPEVGTITLSGRIDRFAFEDHLVSFIIGGQELTIDDICPCE